MEKPMNWQQQINELLNGSNPAEVTESGDVVMVRFSQKPPAEVRTWLKSNGFKWNRSAWVHEPKPETFSVPAAPLSTSCYNNLKRIPEGLEPVCISVGKPRWYSGRLYPPLYPTRKMLKMSIEQYNLLYDEILSKLDPQQVFDELGENSVMLCWEKPGILCHRRRVAEWLEQHLGIVVPELGFDRRGA